MHIFCRCHVFHWLSPSWRKHTIFRNVLRIHIPICRHTVLIVCHISVCIFSINTVYIYSAKGLVKTTGVNAIHVLRTFNIRNRNLHTVYTNEKTTFCQCWSFPSPFGWYQVFATFINRLVRMCVCVYFELFMAPTNFALDILNVLVSIIAGCYENYYF